VFILGSENIDMADIDIIQYIRLSQRLAVWGVFKLCRRLSLVTKKIDIKEAAGLTGMSVAWFRAQILRKRLPFYRIGRRVLFDADDLGELFKRNRVEPLSEARLGEKDGKARSRNAG
jgi:excisionase family DNA binding protein